MRQTQHGNIKCGCIRACMYALHQYTEYDLHPSNVSPPHHSSICQYIPKFNMHSYWTIDEMNCNHWMSTRLKEHLERIQKADDVKINRAQEHVHTFGFRTQPLIILYCINAGLHVTPWTRNHLFETAFGYKQRVGAEQDTVSEFLHEWLSLPSDMSLTAVVWFHPGCCNFAFKWSAIHPSMSAYCDLPPGHPGCMSEGQKLKSHV